MGDIRVKENIDSFEYYYIATSLRELIKAVELCRELSVPFLIFGQGSRILLADMGFKGLGIKNRSGNIKIFSVKGKVSKNGLGIDKEFYITFPKKPIPQVARVGYSRNTQVDLHEKIERSIRSTPNALARSSKASQRRE